MTNDKHKLSPEVERDLAAIDAALSGASVDPELTDLGRLALELRDERPEPDPFFTRELDARAAAGFPRSRPSGVKWFRRYPNAIPGVAVSMLLVVLVAGAALIGPADENTGSGGTSGTIASAPEPETTVTEDDALSGAGTGESSDLDTTVAPQRAAAKPKTLSEKDSESSGAGGAAGAISAPVPGPGGSVGSDGRQKRVQETSASLTLVAPPKNINEVADGIVRVTDTLGGFVVSSTVSATDGDSGGGIFEIRVPSAKLQAALAELSKLAHVQSRQQATQDITAESVSARDRLQDARAERTALLRRLAKAQSTTEIDSLKARLRLVSARIAAAKADVSRVNNRASYSNIAVSLAADPAAGGPGEDDGQWSPGDAARDALRVLEVIAGVALIALAVGIPAALLAVLLLVAARLTARRRRERALDAI